MMAYQKIKNFILKKIGRLILSYADKYMLKVGEG